MKTIPLTQGQVALVDDCDYERVNRVHWWAVTMKRHRTFYAQGGKGPKGNQRRFSMHHYILAVGSDSQVDHRYKKQSLGCFATAREAAVTYDAKALELFGEFARTNAMLGLL